MKYHKSNAATPYPLYSAKVENIEELAQLRYPSKYFVLLLAADFAKIENDQIILIAKKLIDKGLAYICVWGPGCEAAHDAFDMANVLWEEERGKDHHVMSKWHDDEPFEEALWFSLFNAFVEDEFWNECSTIAATINDKIRAKIIDNSFADVSVFNKKMVNG